MEPANENIAESLEQALSYLDSYQASEEFGVMSLELKVSGTVQGVGFRPFIFRLATCHGLAGGVRNEGSFVRIRVAGNVSALRMFLVGLETDLPRAAVIEHVVVRFSMSLPGSLHEPSAGFFILPSQEAASQSSMGIPPDMAICDSCLQDITNPNGRYYRYPFTSCTDCGPRYTLAKRLPFDRATTTMEDFPLCSACDEDYTSPHSRRFHAQATACTDCGPVLSYMDTEGKTAIGESAVTGAIHALLSGKIVAVLGIGGFHLAVNACDESAVQRLRSRKHRPVKPLAVMMRASQIEEYCTITPFEWDELHSPERPIVLLRPREQGDSEGPTPLAPSVAPGMSRIGVFLPYTGIHVLLLENAELSSLVMTSGNLSGEPLAYTVDDGFERLAGIADAFLVHNREILRPVDDSVVRVSRDNRLLLRHSRGYVPKSFQLSSNTGVRAIAVGGDVKNAFAVAANQKLWLGPHVGDLDDPITQSVFEQQLQWYTRLLEITPEYVIHDLHPNYHSSRFAKGYSGNLLGVQHHHAHMAACMLEYAMTGDVVGVLLDGLGFGDDGQIWGGEWLVGNMSAYRRVASLLPLRFIGGDLAVREPWRLVLNYLYELGVGTDTLDWVCRHLGITKSSAAQYRHVLRSNFPGLQSTSTGRLFDVAGALLFGEGVSTFEGELPMKMEALVRPEIMGQYDFYFNQLADFYCLDFRGALLQLITDVKNHVDREIVSTRFHRGFAHALAQVSQQVARDANLRRIVVGGGVWQNEWLLQWFTREMQAEGFEVYVPSRFPLNDGGLAVGQLAVLFARLESSK